MQLTLFLSSYNTSDKMAYTYKITSYFVEQIKFYVPFFSILGECVFINLTSRSFVELQRQEDRGERGNFGLSTVAERVLLNHITHTVVLSVMLYARLPSLDFNDGTELHTCMQVYASACTHILPYRGT